MAEDYLTRVDELLNTHYAEAHNGLVDKPPSQLLRGEGTERYFYILKIDLVGSTVLLRSRRNSTYLKLAHTYLSTIDKITQDYGADPEQVEYAGDSVIAYFPEDATNAEDVLRAACYTRAAVQKMKQLDATLRGIDIKSKVVIHYDKLIVSKIGPRAGSILTAIGIPIHNVAKLEKDITSGAGRATSSFYVKLQNINKKYLSPVYPVTSPVANGLLIPINPPETSQYRLQQLMQNRPYPTGQSSTAGLGLLGLGNIVPTVQPVGYNISWAMLYRALDIPLNLL